MFCVCVWVVASWVVCGLIDLCVPWFRWLVLWIGYLINGLVACVA